MNFKQNFWHQFNTTIFLFSILSLLNTHARAQDQNADPLALLLSTAQKKNEKQPTDAIVTFAIFVEDLQDSKVMDKTLAQILQREIKIFLEHYETLSPKKKVDQDSLSRSMRLSYLKVDQDLPIQLETLTAAADLLSSKISQAKSVIFLRYQGRKLKKQQQLHFMCQLATAILKTGQEKVISNLSTFETMDLPTFQSRCLNFNDGWHRPSIEFINEKSIRLSSRGLTQFAAPELESNALTKDQASQSFNDFQKDLIGIIKQGSKKILPVKQYDNRPISNCQRPELAYENQCIQLTYPIQK
jgi:hypothetical protein